MKKYMAIGVPGPKQQKFQKIMYSCVHDNKLVNNLTVISEK